MLAFIWFSTTFLAQEPHISTKSSNSSTETYENGTLSENSTETYNSSIIYYEHETTTLPARTGLKGNQLYAITLLPI